jgi:hypothetical protein
MYCVPSAHWHTRAEETLALAETMSDGIAKQLTYRIAADYERLAQSVEHRPNRFLPILAVPAEVKQFASLKNCISVPARSLDLELPSFLKLGPATAAELREFRQSKMSATNAWRSSAGRTQAMKWRPAFLRAPK